MSNETSTAPAAEAQPQMAPVELTVQDLGVIRSVIDVATQRGAFKANELEAVGKTYNKLDTFLQQVQKAEEQAKAENAEADAKAPAKE
tara:strand:- start:1177 stop:1440 length:264 start_codon:yes stop_codon:yes gene_type:complete